MISKFNEELLFRILPRVEEITSGLDAEEVTVETFLYCVLEAYLAGDSKAGKDTLLIDAASQVISTDRAKFQQELYEVVKVSQAEVMNEESSNVLIVRNGGGNDNDAGPGVLMLSKKLVKLLTVVNKSIGDDIIKPRDVMVACLVVFKDESIEFLNVMKSRKKFYKVLKDDAKKVSGKLLDVIKGCDFGKDVDSIINESKQSNGLVSDTFESLMDNLSSISDGKLNSSKIDVIKDEKKTGENTDSGLRIKRISADDFLDFVQGNVTSSEYDRDRRRSKLTSLFNSILGNNSDKGKSTNSAGIGSGVEVDNVSKSSILEQFGTNLVEKAIKGEFDKVVGRSTEISKVIEILCCRKKNNAALLGDPGCGKTAIVEGLAQMIAKNEVPDEIKGKKIYSISVMDLLAGTTYRGQLEQRIQNLCKEVASRKDVIIYMDEFHQATSGESNNISQMLKPALGRGEFQSIISTTNGEYRKFVEKDGALKRRFEAVYVEEPTVEETKAILREIAPSYCKFHKVSCSDEVIDKCVEWSGKYINDKFFPDKAITTFDLSCSVAKLKSSDNTNKKEEELLRLCSKQDEIEKRMISLVKEARLEEAGKLRKKLVTVENKIDKLSNSNDPEIRGEVTIEDICDVISRSSGIPSEIIMSNDLDKIKNIKNVLSSKVIGQDEAINELTIALQRNMLGLRDPNKPIASFLLVGPTGVGKSLVSKTLATEFFGSDKNLVTIACSEYMQDWAESKLLGSAPGYVGFSDSEPRLYVLKRKPYSVILVDEIEKSSSNLYNIWLNMLEEGEITLSTGEKVSCKNSIIIFTGNVGTKSLEIKGGDGFGFRKYSSEEKKDRDVSIVMDEVKKEFRPEFLNRLSKVIVFNSLSKNELSKIFDIELSKLKERINYDLVVSDDLKELIISKCEPEYGARSLQRLITEYVEKEICKTMIDSNVDFSKMKVINLNLIKKEKEKDEVVVEFSK
jgi:ATP-dependent Clp protease ATP-binding subunit ClpC